MQIVSRLQGSVSLEDAQSRAREVLDEFRKELVSDTEELSQKVSRHVAANKVLVRALHIVKTTNAASEQRHSSQLASLQAQTEIANERARNAEHTVELLRWHLQHGGGNHSHHGHIGPFPPDVF